MQVNALWDNFFSSDEKKNDIDFLQSIPLFDALKDSELIRLERILHDRKYAKNEEVFFEGEPGAALYIIKEGKIDIYKNYKEEKILLASLGEGTFFGELALFDESPRSATAVTSKDTTLLAFSKPDLALFSEKNPSIGFKISMRLGEILSQRLRIANDNIEESL